MMEMKDDPTDEPRFTDKFVAFVDILGFKKIVQDTEAGKGFTLPELFDVLNKLGDDKHREAIVKYGPTMCPEAPRVRRDIDFQLTQISDCVIVSAEASPCGIINLIGHCWSACFGLLTKGVLCRGYIGRGNVYHTERQVIGTGYINAYLNEGKVSAFRRDDKGTRTPYIEVGPEVVSYINDQPDETVKRVFKRLTASDGALTVLFPFSRLSHSFVISYKGSPFGEFKPEKEKESNAAMRGNVERLKDKMLELVDQEDEDAMRKIAHYIVLLDQQIAVADQIDEMIDNLSRPFGSVATND
jgi:hypothetical protein